MSGTRGGVGVHHSHHIELLIVLDHVEAPVLLLDENNRRCISDFDGHMCCF